MKNGNKIRKNILLQIFYQLINTLFPIITAPYLARVLGKEKLGIFSYTNSIVTYFILFSMLGTVTYATRTIALCKNDEEKLNKNFSEIYVFQFISSLICFVVYSLYLLLFSNEYFIISFIQIIGIINCMFDINWLYNALEKFDFTIKRNIIIKIITVMCILFFVKTPSDLPIYTLIMLCNTFVSNIILFVNLNKIVKFKIPKLNCVLRHFHSNIILFIPILAQSLYHIMDKTMLGILSDVSESGYYYNADKIINIPIGIIAGISTIMLPRITSLITEKKEENARELFYKSMELSIFLSFAMSIGIVSIANIFVPLFFGYGYEKCVILVYTLAPALIIKSISMTFREQFLIPRKLEKIFIKSVIFGGIINILINFFLIPRYGSIGASIGTIIAEIITCIFQFVFLDKKYDFKYKNIISNMFCYSFCSLMMFCSIYLISFVQLNLFIKLLIEIFIGGITYFAFCFIIWKCSNNYIYAEILTKINKFKKN